MSQSECCDICKKNGSEIEAIIDGKTTMGCWAYMCLLCHYQYGVGIGLGKGQYINDIRKKL